MRLARCVLLDRLHPQRVENRCCVVRWHGHFFPERLERRSLQPQRIERKCRAIRWHGQYFPERHEQRCLYPQRVVIIRIFADSMPMFCSLRLWRQAPGFRHYGRYGLARVDVSVYSAMLGFRLYMLCVILRSSTWAPGLWGPLSTTPCLCSQLVVLFTGLRSPGFKLSFFARKGSTGQCVTLILWHTSLSRGSPA